MEDADLDHARANHSGANHAGRCQCGGVRFEAAGPVIFTSNCQCGACRRATGAMFSTWVGFKDEQLRWLTKEPDFFASSPGVKRGFCAACGTPLSYQGEKWAGETHLLIGVFDKPENYKPIGEAFSDEALPFAYHRPPTKY